MDLTEGLILSSMMGNGGGSGGGGNPGYHVETENLGTLIPQQTVTTEDQNGWNVASLNIVVPEGMTELPESLQVVFNGVIYNCPKAEDSDEYGAHWDDSLNDGEGGIDWSEYPFSIVFSSAESMDIATESEGTYTVQADMVGTQLVIDPEFEEAVNTVVGDSGGSSESELPSVSGKSGAFLQVDSREEGVQWKKFGWLPQTSQNNNPAIMKDDNLNIKRLYFSQTELVQLRTFIRNYGFGPLKADAILPVYSANGLEIVYHIDTQGTATIIYDKNTTTGSTAAYGEVILFY